MKPKIRKKTLKELENYKIKIKKLGKIGKSNIDDQKVVKKSRSQKLQELNTKKKNIPRLKND